MATDEVAVPQRGHGTVSFKRAVQIRPYNSAEAFLSVQFDFDPAQGDVTHQDSLVAKAKDAYFQAKALVLDELGLPWEVIEGGFVMEKLSAAFGNVTEVGQDELQEMVANANASRPAQGQVRDTKPAATASDKECPKCAGPMWDNRGRKTNPKQPDFRCKDKDNCDGVIWPPRKAS